MLYFLTKHKTSYYAHFLVLSTEQVQAVLPVGIFRGVFNVEVLQDANALHVVGGNTLADALCVQCGLLLGWRYIAVPQPSMSIRQGRFLMILHRLTYWNNDPLFPLHDVELEVVEENADQDGGANEQNADQDGGANEQNDDPNGGANEQNDDPDGGANEQNADHDGGASENNDDQDGGANEHNADQDGGANNEQNADQDVGANNEQNADHYGGANEQNADHDGGAPMH
ncbi:hypothetical protein BC332_17136 [Capsicum chinense]|nr:hypothetical protein BC332_17136 [Capsicum chinense]